jgi:C4-type Zn-finger protein
MSNFDLSQAEIDDLLRNVDQLKSSGNLDLPYCDKCMFKTKRIFFTGKKTDIYIVNHKDEITNHGKIRNSTMICLKCGHKMYFQDKTNVSRN